jgi:pyruvate/2-oxoglutarate/acetoin dehydrogenase E1 component
MSRQITMGEAIREAIREEMAAQDDLSYFGIDVVASHCGLTDGLFDKYGPDRIVNTPIAESTIVGMGIGSALMGARAVCEIMFEDFSMLAMDHLYNTMGTQHYLTNGQYNVPLTVIMVSGGGAKVGAGPGHSQSLRPLFMSAPGIHVCLPSTPYDAKGLLKTALRSKNPCIYSVDRTLLGGGYSSITGDLAGGEVPAADYSIPFGEAKVVREGSDVTVVALGKMVRHALSSAAELAKEGVQVEVIDPRTISPLDKDTILKSVAKTGRLVVAEESRIVNGVGAEILALVASEDPRMLKAPAKRVAAPMIPVPAAAVLEEMYLPNSDDISNSIRETLGKSCGMAKSVAHA